MINRDNGRGICRQRRVPYGVRAALYTEEREGSLAFALECFSDCFSLFFLTSSSGLSVCFLTSFVGLATVVAVATPVKGTTAVLAS